MIKRVILKIALAGLISFCSLPFYGQDLEKFEIIANNEDDRSAITDTIKSDGFTVGVNKNGGGYITEISIPEIGNTMGAYSQSYGRGGQSSIRDGARGGQYNPTQAGFSDEGGTVCEVVKTTGKIVIPTRGCALFNGDGKFDYTRFENIVSDPSKWRGVPEGYDDNNNSDQDIIDEENLSVVIDGRTFTKQAAEVHSEFDFYCEYENIKTAANLSTPAIRHYFEYRFVRSSTSANAAMKQFNMEALKSAQEWYPEKLSLDISEEHPYGEHPGDLTNVNDITLSWSIRTDVDIWDPPYRYVQDNDGNWETILREGVFRGRSNSYKLRFIIADSDDQNIGHALGFYLPESELNTYNIVGINKTDGSVAYRDDRTTDSFYLDNPRRIEQMSWIGFRSNLNGLIDISNLAPENPGVYEKIRQETIMLYGTPAEIKTAFIQLDNYFATLSTPKYALNNKKEFNMYPNPTNGTVNIALNSSKSAVNIYNVLGLKLLSFSNLNKQILSIPATKIGSSGIYFVQVNNTIKKLIID